MCEPLLCVDQDLDLGALGCIEVVELGTSLGTRKGGGKVARPREVEVGRSGERICDGVEPVALTIEAVPTKGTQLWANVPCAAQCVVRIEPRGGERIELAVELGGRRRRIRMVDVRDSLLEGRELWADELLAEFGGRLIAGVAASGGECDRRRDDRGQPRGTEQ